MHDYIWFGYFFIDFFSSGFHIGKIQVHNLSFFIFSPEFNPFWVMVFFWEFSPFFFVICNFMICLVSCLKFVFNTIKRKVSGKRYIKKSNIHFNMDFKIFFLNTFSFHSENVTTTTSQENVSSCVLYSFFFKVLSLVDNIFFLVNYVVSSCACVGWL